MTAIAAALVEAWQEIRVHRLRVVLSLIGVAVAVSSLTFVSALSTMMERSLGEWSESMTGREGTETIEVSSTDGQLDYAAVRAELDEVLAERDVRYSTVSSELYFDDVEWMNTQVTVAEPAYQPIHRIRLESGRWFAPGDEQNLSPAVVVDENMANHLGVDGSALPAVAELGPDGTTVTVIGMTPAGAFDNEYLYLMPSAVDLMPSLREQFGSSYTFKVWMPPEISRELAQQIAETLQSRIAGTDVMVDPFGMADMVDDDPLRVVNTIMLVVGLIILMLGALGLVNIGLVTVSARIREIGIRRSLGATGSRVFFAVMMESVVATAVAGFIGVMIAVLILRLPIMAMVVGSEGGTGMAVPVSAAVVGMSVAVGVGALAGLLPAIIATRVRIIDAIRQ